MGDKIKLRMPEGVSAYEMTYEWSAEKFTDWCLNAHKEAEGDPDWWKNVETPLGLSRRQLSIPDNNWKTIVLNLMEDGLERTAVMINEEICLANDIPFDIGSSYPKRPHATSVHGAIMSLLRAGFLANMGKKRMSQLSNRHITVYKIASRKPKYFNGKVDKAIKNAEVRFLPKKVAMLSVYYGRTDLNFENGFGNTTTSLMSDGKGRTQGEILEVLLAANGIEPETNIILPLRSLFLNIKNAVENLVRQGILQRSGETIRVDVHTDNDGVDRRRTHLVGVFTISSAASAGVRKHAKSG